MKTASHLTSRQIAEYTAAKRHIVGTIALNLNEPVSGAALNKAGEDILLHMLDPKTRRQMNRLSKMIHA